MNKRLKKRIKNIFYFMIVTVATFIFIVPFCNRKNNQKNGFRDNI